MRGKKNTKMKIKLFVLFISLFVLIGCQKNISLSMQSADDKLGNNFINTPKNMINERFYDDSYFELGWGEAFPINYFSYDYKSTTLFLHQYGNPSSEILITNLKIDIEAWNYSQIFCEEKDMTIKKNNKIYIINLINCMSDILHEEQDLLKLGTLDTIKVIITVGNEINNKELIFDFSPKIIKSNKILDNLMSI